MDKTLYKSSMKYIKAIHYTGYSTKKNLKVLMMLMYLKKIKHISSLIKITENEHRLLNQLIACLNKTNRCVGGNIPYICKLDTPVTPPVPPTPPTPPDPPKPICLIPEIDYPNVLEHSWELLGQPEYLGGEATIRVKVKMSIGNYQYGPATGVKIKEIRVYYQNGEYTSKEVTSTSTTPVVEIEEDFQIVVNTNLGIKKIDIIYDSDPSIFAYNSCGEKTNLRIQGSVVSIDVNENKDVDSIYSIFDFINTQAQSLTTPKVIRAGQKFDTASNPIKYVLTFPHSHIVDNNILTYKGKYTCVREIFKNGELKYSNTIIMENEEAKVSSSVFRSDVTLSFSDWSTTANVEETYTYRITFTPDYDPNDLKDTKGELINKTIDPIVLEGVYFRTVVPDPAYVVIVYNSDENDVENHINGEIPVDEGIYYNFIEGETINIESHYTGSDASRIIGVQYYVSTGGDSWVKLETIRDIRYIINDEDKLNPVLTLIDMDDNYRKTFKVEMVKSV